jgi:hypothetical protein
MRTHTTITCLTLMASALGASLPTAEMLTIHNHGSQLALQTGEHGDKAPHRGSGRRQFFQSVPSEPSFA